MDATLDVESRDLGCSKLSVASSARHAAGLRGRRRLRAGVVNARNSRRGRHGTRAWVAAPGRTPSARYSCAVGINVTWLGTISSPVMRAASCTRPAAGPSRRARRRRARAPRSGTGARAHPRRTGLSAAPRRRRLRRPAPPRGPINKRKKADPAWDPPFSALH